MSRVLRERDTSTVCFSTIRLDSGETVMVSIAPGEAKILRMKWGGILPSGTLWKSTNLGEIALVFSSPGQAFARPLERIRNTLLQFGSITDLEMYLRGAGPAADGRLTGSAPSRVVFDVNNLEDVQRMDQIRSAYGDLLEQDTSAYADCMFKPAEMLPFPRTTIAAALSTLLDFAEGRVSSLYIDGSLRGPDVSSVLQMCLETLDDFLDLPASAIPTERMANLRFGMEYRNTSK